MTNKPTIKDCMEQAQIFASTWGRVGNGVFGTTVGHATAEKEKLEAMLRAALATPAQPVAHVSQETFNDDGTSDIIIPALPIGMALYAAPQPAAQAQHPDDAAVEKLAEAMKQKLAEKRAQGRSGWDTDCTQQRLSDLLRQHVEKGDVLDVANFCAFLFARGERVSAVQPKSANEMTAKRAIGAFSN